jgi:lysophospholipase
VTGPAPLHADLADGPPGGRAFWLRAADGTRIRAAHWPCGGTARGTVLLFPGRTEYVEKYGRTAADLARRGYDTLAIDWRGQGLADRALPDPMTGHVGRFDEYQQDVAALVDLARHLCLPEPFFLIAHSMGGCIGLRALMQGLPVRAAAFSAPMWGIMMAASLRPAALALSALSRMVGQAHRYAPGTTNQTYVAQFPFAGNVLTTDADMYAYMKRQVLTCPELSLGGPSMGWLNAALAECADLARQPAPNLPALCALGTSEKVVDPLPIHRRMAGWPKGRLDLYPGAEHEVIMELPAHRDRFLDSAAALFAAQQ